MAVYEIQSCMQGYHIYKDIWTAMIGDLLCEREPFNDVDRYAIAVLKDDNTVAHIPKKISKICSVLARGGNMACTSIGGRRYSADLPQWGYLVSWCLLVNRKKFKRLRRCLPVELLQTVKINNFEVL